MQAPTVGSVIPAGVMLKFGTYGLVRFALQMTPEAFRTAGVVVLAFGVVSAIYGAFVALAQTDLKRMIAYTSVNHMGYVVIAVAAMATDPAMRAVALDGATLQMISHGLVTGALFFLVGMLKERGGTYDMASYGGLLKVTPVLGWSFVLMAFASLGLPGLAHFPAEFQIFLATLNVAPWGLSRSSPSWWWPRFICALSARCLWASQTRNGSKCRIWIGERPLSLCRSLP